MTRLRVTVKDPEKVAEIDKWRENGALGLFKKGNGIQAVYGPKADILKLLLLHSAKQLKAPSVRTCPQSPWN